MRPALMVAICALLLTVGCAGRSEQRSREYMPDMVRSSAYRSYSANEATSDGLTLRHPVAGTVARGYQPFHYGATPDEAERAGRELLSPLPITAVTLADGKELFETHCAICHGLRGRGDGPLVPRIPNPPSYLSQRLLAMPAGRIFHVITRGAGRMPSYAAQISAGERWKIVTYVQFLQRNGESQ